MPEFRKGELIYDDMLDELQADYPVKPEEIDTPKKRKDLTQKHITDYLSKVVPKRLNMDKWRPGKAEMFKNKLAGKYEKALAGIYEEKVIVEAPFEEFEEKVKPLPPAERERILKKRVSKKAEKITKIKEPSEYFKAFKALEAEEEKAYVEVLAPAEKVEHERKVREAPFLTKAVEAFKEHVVEPVAKFFRKLFRR
jgi:hypothetical protein